MKKNYDAVIIGAGVIGAATAFELAKLGYKTLSVDKLPAAGYGPTSNSCAVIRMHYSTWDGIIFAYEGYFYWRDWADYLEAADERGLIEFIQCGCLVMKSELNGQLAKHCALADEFEVPYEHWSPDQVRAKLPIYDLKRFFPAKRMTDPAFGEPTGGEVEGAVFFPTAGYVSDPQLATHNLQRAAEAKGAEFLFGKAVTEILKQDGRISGLRLDDGSEIEAPVVVNVAGPHSAVINGLAGALDDMTITTKPLRQEVAHVPAPEGFDFEKLGTVVSDSDIACYCRPETGNHILIGSEDPPCDGHEVVDPDDYNRDFTEQWTHQVQRYAQRVPSLGIPNSSKGCVDLYDMSDDWIPIYDKSQVPGFYMAIGTSGNQFKNAPIAGKMMAALIDYCEKGGDHDKEPLQFELPYLKRTIDAGFYSRKRPINKESSFSVLG